MTGGAIRIIIYVLIITLPVCLAAWLQRLTSDEWERSYPIL